MSLQADIDIFCVTCSITIKNRLSTLFGIYILLLFINTTLYKNFLHTFITDIILNL